MDQVCDCIGLHDSLDVVSWIPLASLPSSGAALFGHAAVFIPSSLRLWGCPTAGCQGSKGYLFTALAVGSFASWMVVLHHGLELVASTGLVEIFVEWLFRILDEVLFPWFLPSVRR